MVHIDLCILCDTCICRAIVSTRWLSRGKKLTVWYIDVTFKQEVRSLCLVSSHWPDASCISIHIRLDHRLTKKQICYSCVQDSGHRFHLFLELFLSMKIYKKGKICSFSNIFDHKMLHLEWIQTTWFINMHLFLQLTYQDAFLFDKCFDSQTS